MRLMVYNIAYGTGNPGSHSGRLLTTHRYFYTNNKYFERIIDFTAEIAPDIVGLIESDSGSFRTGQQHQAEQLASHLDFFQASRNKYGNHSPWRLIPLLRHQSNAVLAEEQFVHRFHEFPCGVKKLIIEVELETATLFLVHLSVRRKIRSEQLDFLSQLLPRNRAIIVAGDFNTFSGEQELNELKNRCRLRNANKNAAPTYPAWQPKHQLDYILYSKELTLNHFFISRFDGSDHLPLIADFSINPVFAAAPAHKRQ